MFLDAELINNGLMVIVLVPQAMLGLMELVESALLHLLQINRKQLVFVILVSFSLKILNLVITVLQIPL